jgi:hypothetical protein
MSTALPSQGLLTEAPFTGRCIAFQATAGFHAPPSGWSIDAHSRYQMLLMDKITAA